MFVKPLRSDASLGVSKKSLVTDAVQLMRRVAAIREELNDSAIASTTGVGGASERKYCASLKPIYRAVEG